MSSMLRTLLRSTSDRQTDASNKGSMPSSPSFSDFSMGVGQEEMPTEDVHAQSLPSEPARGFWRRSLDRSVSLGSSGSSDSANSGTGSPDKALKDTNTKPGRSAGMAIPQADRTFQNHFMPAAARQAGAPPADAKPPRQKYPEKKIDGMDYYEFCELIRSNSL